MTVTRRESEVLFAAYWYTREAGRNADHYLPKIALAKSGETGLDLSEEQYAVFIALLRARAHLDEAWEVATRQRP